MKFITFWELRDFFEVLAGGSEWFRPGNARRTSLMFSRACLLSNYRRATRSEHARDPPTHARPAGWGYRRLSRPEERREAWVPGISEIHHFGNFSIFSMLSMLLLLLLLYGYNCCGMAINWDYFGYNGCGMAIKTIQKCAQKCRYSHTVESPYLFH